MCDGLLLQGDLYFEYIILTRFHNVDGAFMAASQYCPIVVKNVLAVIMLVFGISYCGLHSLHAQGFAEDFSDPNLLNYSLTTSGALDTPIMPSSSRAPVLSGAFIRQTSNAEAQTLSQRLNVHSDSNLLEARAILNPAASNREGTTGTRIQLRLYNDTENGGPGYVQTGRGSANGDVRLLLEYRATGSQTPTVRLRSQRFSNGGFSDITNFFNLDNGTTSGNIRIPDVDTRVGIEHTLLLDVDLQNRRITYGFDGFRETLTFNAGSMFTPNRLQKGIETQVFENRRDGASKDIRASVTINGIRTDRFENDFTRQVPFLRFTFPDTERPASTITLANDEILVSTQRTNTSSGTLSTELLLEDSIVEHTDYHEATIAISSLSNIASGREMQVRLAGNFYNDLPNGSEGSVRGDNLAFIALVMFADGSTNAIYCLTRFNNASGSDLTVTCNDFDSNFSPNIDTSYQATITLDRAARTLRYTLEGSTNSFQRTININTSINDPAATTRFVNSYLPQGQIGQAVGIFDNIRTGANAEAQRQEFVEPLPVQTAPPPPVPQPPVQQPPVEQPPVQQPPVPQPPVPQPPVQQPPVQQPPVPQTPVPQPPVPQTPVPQPPVPQLPVPQLPVQQTPVSAVIVGAGNGCSITAGNKAANDPLKLVMLAVSFGFCCWRKKRRG